MSLATPPGLSTRPTPSRVREAVFSLLAPDIHQDATFLDLFAGSGAMGFEALSRGVGRAIFIEQNGVAQKCLHQSAEEITRRAAVQGLIKPDIKIIKHDALKGTWVVRAAVKSEGVQNLGPMVDLVYIDPPYEKVQTWAKPLFELLAQVVRPHGKIIFESRGGQDTEFVKEVVASMGDFQWIKSKSFGEVGITVCERNSASIESTMG